MEWNTNKIRTEQKNKWIMKGIESRKRLRRAFGYDEATYEVNIK